MASPLGIIAGGGELPISIAKQCIADGRGAYVIALEEAANPADYPAGSATSFRIGAIGGILKHLKKAGAEEILLAGHIKRPSLSGLRPDLKGTQLLAKLGSKILGGDDSLLRFIIEFLESEGLKVVGVADVAPALLAAEGILGAIEPNKTIKEDIEYGLPRAIALGKADIGQAVVCYNKAILAAEALEGTERMIARAGEIRHDDNGGTLIKCSKPQQELRADLPTIGVDTVEQCKQAGLHAIAIQAQKTIILNRTAVIEAANKAGIALIGINVDG